MPRQSDPAPDSDKEFLQRVVEQALTHEISDTAYLQRIARTAVVPIASTFLALTTQRDEAERDGLLAYDIPRQQLAELEAQVAEYREALERIAYLRLGDLAVLGEPASDAMERIARAALSPKEPEAEECWDPDCGLPIPHTARPKGGTDE